MEMKDKNKAKAIADERMRLIAPLLSPALDCAQIKQMKEELSKANGKHYRCISSLWDSPLYGNMRFWRVRTGGFMDDSCRRDHSLGKSGHPVCRCSTCSQSCSEMRCSKQSFLLFSSLYILIYLLSTSSTRK